MGRGGRQAGSLVGRFVARRGERGGGNNVKVRLGGRWWRHVFALSLSTDQRIARTTVIMYVVPVHHTLLRRTLVSMYSYDVKSSLY